VWTRTVNGRALHFYLAGINNQNFLMRDKETGTWWQQITGKALYGPLQGASLELVPSDEITFGEWKSEVSDGKVLAEVPKYVKEYDSNWEPDVAKLPVVISFPGTELKSRDVVVGLEIEGPARAYPWDALVKQSPVMDHVHNMPLLVAVGPDGKSFRVFVSRVDGKDTEFYLKQDPEPAAASAKPDAPPETKVGEEKKQKEKQTEATETEKKKEKPASTTPVSGSAGAPAAVAGANDSHAVEQPKPSAAPSPTPKPWILLDTATASEWNFQGCAISGPSQGKCLDRIPALKDYWFDWRNYHPDTTLYKR
jgi:ribosomal protein L12E/L44/L45/RPP1/RPP2